MSEKKSQINWRDVQRVLVVRLRSIGDTVLSTPSLFALRRFLPEARIDILLEDWIAPLLEDSDLVDNIIAVPNKNSLAVDKNKLSSKDLLLFRALLAWSLRETKYDVAFNLHGGTTGTFFVRASGAKHRVGFENYQYNFLYNHLLSSASDFWQKDETHSAEQQLALLGFVGVPVADKPKSRLTVTEKSLESLEKKFNAKMQRREDAKVSLLNNANLLSGNFALIHPAAAFDTKQWATEKFALAAEYLSAKGLPTIAVAAGKERRVLDDLEKFARVPILSFDDLTLPEITVLASRAKIFVGNDSGIAHIAAAVQTPTVVVFGSSNVNHWRPWTNAPNEIVCEKLPCQPCAGYFCKEFGDPKCIQSVKTENVFEAIEKVLSQHQI